jgi:hypothetical protein
MWEARVQQDFAAAGDFCGVRRIEFEACVAVQHRVAVDRGDLRNVGRQAVANQQ